MNRLILAGGGNPKDSRPLDEYYDKLLSTKRLLYLSQAVAPRTWSYSRAYFWLRRNKTLHDFRIRMWKKLEDRSFEDLANFDTIYIMGGNTFDLAYKLRKTGFIRHLRRFIRSGRIVYGISAGAVILGRNIGIAQIGHEADKNMIGLRNLRGLNLLGGHNVLPHYTPDQDSEILDYERRTGIPVLSIPERSGVYLQGARALALGYEPVQLHQEGVKQTKTPGSRFLLKN